MSFVETYGTIVLLLRRAGRLRAGEKAKYITRMRKGSELKDDDDELIPGEVDLCLRRPLLWKKRKGQDNYLYNYHWPFLYPFTEHCGGDRSVIEPLSDLLSFVRTIRVA